MKQIGFISNETV